MLETVVLAILSEMPQENDNCVSTVIYFLFKDVGHFTE